MWTDQGAKRWPFGLWDGFPISWATQGVFSFITSRNNNGPLSVCPDLTLCQAGRGNSCLHGLSPVCSACQIPGLINISRPFEPSPCPPLRYCLVQWAFSRVLVSFSPGALLEYQTAAHCESSGLNHASPGETLVCWTSPGSADVQAWWRAAASCVCLCSVLSH